MHNSYVQISCEAGIPAALLFIAGMVICLRKKRREMVEIATGQAAVGSARPETTRRFGREPRQQHDARPLQSSSTDVHRHVRANVSFCLR